MKILNYGSMNIDHVYSVPHAAAPGETIIASSLSLFCGGKGLNQSVAIARAGGIVYHAGLIGDDGAMLLDRLSSCGVHTEYVEQRPGASCHTVIQVDTHGQNSIVVCNTPGLQFSGEDLDRILSEFDAGDYLILQNEMFHSALMMKKAVQKGMKVVFNPSPINQGIQEYPLDQVDWLILNEIEGEAISGESDPQNMLKELHSRYPRMNVMLTLGEKGSLCLAGEQLHVQSAFPIPTVDTTAAGDAFTGYFVTGLVRGDPLPEILFRASVAAGITVSRHGAADSIPSAAEVDKFISKKAN